MKLSREWSEPECYDANSTADRWEMRRRQLLGGAKKLSHVAEIATDLYDISHPYSQDDETARERFEASILKEGDRYGKWFYFSWTNQLVQYPDKDTHRQLRTNRNRELITPDEQYKLGATTLAYCGLSVGMSVLLPATHMGLGDKVIFADPDRVSPTNLNRLPVGMTEVGMRKTDVAGMIVSELDPYVEQVHFRSGITKDNSDQLIRLHPDILFEHADHLPTKLLMRNIARRLEEPLIMATDIGDNSLIDVERYDTEAGTPFLGRLGVDEIERLERDDLSPEERLDLVVRIIGREHISDRMMQSLGNIGVSLSGIAQLGTTAAAGGAYSAIAARDIILGRGPGSGRYIVSPQQIFNRE